MRIHSLHKCAGNCQHFGVVPLQLAEVCGNRDPDPRPSGIPILLDEDHIIRIEACRHAFPRHLVSDDECLLFLPLDGQQHLVAHLAHAVLGVHVDDPWCAVVRRVAQRAVVHDAHPAHLLDGCGNR